jgi:hypothetical protein
MITKYVEIGVSSVDFNGESISVSHMEYQYEDEPISKNILESMNDFYNMMHLIKNSWTNEKYILKNSNAGYDIYDENDELVAWFGITEKSKYLDFVITGWGNKIYKKADEVFKLDIKTLKANNEKGIRYTRAVDENEDWIYSKLELENILKGETAIKQREILTDWINKTIGEIL